MILFEMFIPGLVQPNQSPQVRVIKDGAGRARGVTAYTPKKVRNFSAFVRDLAVAAHKLEGPIDQPVLMVMDVWLPRPKSRPLRCRFPDRKPDLDNIEKPIVDALQAAQVICNDSRICRKSVAKFYVEQDKPPGVLVQLRDLR
jgi:Holliday junction resolvase RusA-like endonuclease